MAVTFHVVDGAVVIIRAGLGFARNDASADAFAGLRTVLRHKFLIQLHCGWEKWDEG